MNTLTITLGGPVIANPSGAPSVAVYNPAPASGITGTISSPSEEQLERTSGRACRSRTVHGLRCRVLIAIGVERRTP